MTATTEDKLPPSPFGISAAYENAGSSAAPLLAGFSFTLIALVVTNSDRLAQPNLALVFLVLAALLLVNAVQFAVRARAYYVPADEMERALRLVGDTGTRTAIEAEGDGWRKTHKRALTWTRIFYNAGIVLLLAGVAVVLIPPGPLARVSDLRLAAAGLVALGALIEAVQAGWPAISAVGTWLARPFARSAG